jgi:hypothetical protein
MRLITWSWVIVPIVAIAGCYHVGPPDEDLSATSQNPLEDQVDPESPDDVEYAYSGVDILLVVDNSGSMREEQAMLSTAVFTLVSGLTDPLPGWTFPPVDDVRIGVVSSDMGLQWGGNPYENGDGWPGDAPQSCGSVGDDGAFQVYTSGKSIDLQAGVIPCGEDGSQCPVGWTCQNLDEQGLGRCEPVDDPTGLLECPGFDTMFAETTLDEPNGVLAEQVACLSDLGTSGCGFEQQLVAGVAGAEHNALTFVRHDALLALMVISDEDDCSIEDSALFGVPEIQDLAAGEVNIACGLHDNFLYSPADLRQRLVEVKGGDETMVVFAALMGVPQDPACEGAGHMIDGCLLHPAMAAAVIQENDASFFQPACERYAGDTLVTKARPGRRFVRTALEFQEYGFVYSICHDDWAPVMESFARLILRAMWLVEEPDDEEYDDAPSCSVARSLGSHPQTGLTEILGFLVE